MLDDTGCPAAKVVDDRSTGEAVVIHEARQRFVATFPRQCDSIAQLIDSLSQLGADGPVDSLRRMLHNIAGHAGTIGFPKVGAGAAAIEALIADAPPIEFDSRSALQLVAALREDFATDLTSGCAEASIDLNPAPCSETGKILVVEDDPQTRAGLTEYLIGAGYSAIALPAAESLLDVARDERPDLILLDVGLPGIDGFAACRLLKTAPDLSYIPVIFLTAYSHIDDRLAGLALGAEQFLSKPVDMRELKLRVQLQLAHRDRVGVSALTDDRRHGKSSYAAFVDDARDVLQQSAAALALVRLPRERRADASAGVTDALRRRELVGRYDPGHLVILMPEASANDARVWLTDVIAELDTRDIHGIHAGVAASPSAGARALDALLVEADEALAEARSFDEPVATKTARPRASRPARGATVVLADDDPEITRLVDTQLHAAGYRTVIAFDGAQAIAAVETHRPDVLVLDLMLPKMSGFQVMDALGHLEGGRPHIVVLSGRAREEDVIRAFAAGATDYMTKPFNVRELLVRIDRLVRSAPNG